jgi:Terminase large subunit, T4likevirus-type, N-terminal
LSLLDELLAKIADPEIRRLGMEGTKNLSWVPNIGPQTDAYFTLADETFYGGQAGGGKTDLGLGLAITQHRRSLILRRFNKDAVKLVERAEGIVGHRNGYNGQQQRWKFPDGRLIEFGGCEQESDKQRYKGDPHDLIVFDEGCDFVESQYRFIIGWNRSNIPCQRCRILVTSNPPTTAAGLWVILRWAAWLDPNHPKPAQPKELRWYTTVNGVDTEVEGAGPHMINGERIMARSRTYIPAALRDNPDYDGKYELQEDGTQKWVAGAGEYHSVLASLPDELRRAYRDGDWSVGQRDDDWQAIPTAWVPIS